MSVFKTSINIKFDFGKTDVISRYLPTPSHADPLNGLLNGINNNGTRSHIIVGPYGTGKSLLGTIIGSVLSKNTSEEDKKNLIEKFDNIDDNRNIYNLLDTIQKSDNKYIPIILNGNEGRLRTSVMSQLMKVLEYHGIKIVIPGVVGKILNALETWNVNFPLTYYAFLEELKIKGTELNDWKQKVIEYDNDSIYWFKSIFPKLTSGVEFSIDLNEDFLEQIKFVLDKLKEENIGLFIIHDEFGRFMQSLNNENIFEAMQDLQDLAELANNYSELFNILLISHRNFRQYALKFDEDLQHEFDRIEKRFKVYHIKSDKATYVRLSHELLKQLDPPLKMSNSSLSKIDLGLSQFPLFSELQPVEQNNYIRNGSYPLHPVTLYVLPFLSNIFAQNERTLFTFLESDENGGLVRHINKNKGWYEPDELFDFFYPSLVNDRTSEALIIYNKILSRHNLQNKEIKILRFITLWRLAEQENQFNISTELISFAFLWTNSKTTDSLKGLQDKKVIRYNQNTEGWELFEGSIVDIARDIEIRKNSTLFSNENKVEIYHNNLSRGHFLSFEYNDDKSMTRFASVKFVYSSDIIDGKLNTVKIRNELNSDALVINILLDSRGNKKEIIDIIKELNDPFVYYCLPNFTNIDDQVKNLTIIEELLKDKKYLIQDKPYLEKELIFMLEDLSYRIESYTKEYSSFDINTSWYYMGEAIEVSNSAHLEKRLSALMYKVYPLTPEIRNDSFNRRRINSVQKNAAINVLDHLLSFKSENNIGIEGNGPDYLIYASLIKNNNINLGDPGNSSNASLNLLRENLLEYLGSYPKGQVRDLIIIFESEPFGMRRPLIPIYLVSLLRNLWSDVIFYSNGMYIDSSKGSNIYDMVMNSDTGNYTYDYFKLDIKYNEVIHDLKELFHQYFIGERTDEHVPSRVCNAMLSWLRTLPRLTQTTENLEKDVKEFRDNIKRSEVNPIKGIEYIYEIYKSNHKLSIRTMKQKLDSYFISHKKELINNIYKQFNVSNYEELMNLINLEDEVLKKNNPLINTIANSNNSNWLERLCYALVGVERKNWTDTTSYTFEKQLENELEKIKNKDDYYSNAINIKVGDKQLVVNEVELSPKSILIYDNTRRIIKNAGRNVPKTELEYILYKLLIEAFK